MKKYLQALLLTIVLFTSIAYQADCKGLPGNPLKKQVLNNGWRLATVQYINTTSFTNQTYNLQVKVEGGTVTAINFGNGAIVHAGINKEGYTYSGGEVNVTSKKDGSEISATTIVVVKDQTGSGEIKISL